LRAGDTGSVLANRGIWVASDVPSILSGHSTRQRPSSALSRCCRCSFVHSRVRLSKRLFGYASARESQLPNEGKEGKSIKIVRIAETFPLGFNLAMFGFSIRDRARERFVNYRYSMTPCNFIERVPRNLISITSRNLAGVHQMHTGFPLSRRALDGHTHLAGRHAPRIINSAARRNPRPKFTCFSGGSALSRFGADVKPPLNLVGINPAGPVRRSQVRGGRMFPEMV